MVVAENISWYCHNQTTDPNRNPNRIPNRKLSLLEMADPRNSRPTPSLSYALSTRCYKYGLNWLQSACHWNWNIIQDQLVPKTLWHTTSRQHQWIIKRTRSSSAQLETGTVSQKKLYLHPLLNPSGTTSHHKLPPGYSTSTGERESRPFREEPGTSVPILSMALALYFFGYPCTLHCRHANPHSWSGVFNLLKFDLTPKKKKMIRSVIVYVSDTSSSEHPLNVWHILFIKHNKITFIVK